jgi:hypothetical protein
MLCIFLLLLLIWLYLAIMIALAWVSNVAESAFLFVFFVTLTCSQNRCQSWIGTVKDPTAASQILLAKVRSQLYVRLVNWFVHQTLNANFV